MTRDDLIEHLLAGGEVPGDAASHLLMREISQEAIRICFEINTAYRTSEELVALFSKLTGRVVPSSFRIFPPFNADFGKNIHVGEDVFINSGCKFQDQGGIFIGDRALIGHNVVLATLNHPLAPARRAAVVPAPIHIEEDVWIGAGAVVCPGVRIGAGAVVAAGAVVVRNVPPMTVAGGVPAQVIKRIEA